MKILEVNCRRRNDGRYTHQSRIIEIKNCDWYELEPMEGALEVLKELHENYRIVICSNRNVENIEMFVTTVRNLFGDVIDDIIPIIDSFDKSIIKGDIRIDDKIECMMNDCSSFNILFGDYGYNKNCDEDDFDYRAFSWNEVLDAVREFEEWN